MTEPLSFCVVIPMYNEETAVEKCIRAVCQALDLLPYRTELIVVNDGSRDKTGEVLAQLTLLYSRLTVVTHPQNSGYGSAVKTGARRGADMNFDYVLFMDSDLTNDPKYIADFVEKMLDGFDVIKASRYIKGGRVIGVPFYRVIISLIGNAVARMMFGLSITDCTNGFMAMKTDILKQMPLTEHGFAVILEELYYAKFYG